MYNFRSIYYNFAGQTLEWMPGDSKEMYEYNLIHNYAQLLKNNWIDRKIEYKFNNAGFRCDDFDTSPAVMFLGCSFTFGVGIPLEESWTHIVSQSLKLKSINLGQGAGSPDTAFRMGLGYIPKLKPKVVVYLQPPGARIELVTKNNIELLMPTDEPVHPFFKEWTRYDDQNRNINADRNKYAIKQLATDYECKFIYANSDIDFLCFDRARDLLHDGTKSHAAFAKFVLEKF